VGPRFQYPLRVRKETAGPSTTLPRISCRTWWRWRTSCGFLYGKPHTRPCPALRGRKSGYAPVPRHAGAGGMTNWFGYRRPGTQTNLSSRPVDWRTSLLDRQQRVGAPFKPYFGLSGTTDVDCYVCRISRESEGKERWYPTQAKVRLEWGTHPLLPVKQAGPPNRCVNQQKPVPRQAAPEPAIETRTG
jgi:hypothetical protein